MQANSDLTNDYECTFDLKQIAPSWNYIFWYA